MCRAHPGCQGRRVNTAREHLNNLESESPSALSSIRWSALEAARRHLFQEDHTDALLVRGELGSGRTVLLSRLIGSARGAGFAVRHLPSLLLDDDTAEAMSQVDEPTLYVYDEGAIAPARAAPFDETGALRLALAVAESPYVRAAIVADEPALASVATTIEVDPVPDSDAFSFVSSRASWAAPTCIDRVVELAEGNLALLVQGANDLRNRTNASASMLQRITLPEQYAALAGQFLSSPPATQQCLAVAAVRAGDLVLGRVDAALAVFLKPVGGRFRLRSPIHRTAVLEACDSDLLRQAHALAARDGTVADHQQRVHHAHALRDRGASLVKWASETSHASASAVVHAHLTSANLTAAHDNSEAVRRHGRALSTAALAGDLVFAEQLVSDDRTDLRQDAEAMIGAALARGLGHGDIQGARSLALRAVAATTDIASIERALAAIAVFNVLTHDVDAWKRWHQLATHSASPGMHRLLAAVSQALEGSEDIAPVDLERPLAARSVVDELTEGLVGTVLPEHSWEASPGTTLRHPRGRLARALTSNVRAAQLIRGGSWDDALLLTGDAARIARSGGARTFVLASEAMSAMTLALMGQAERARTVALDVLSDPLTGRCERVAVTARHALFHIALQNDDADTVLASVTESDNLAFDGGAYPAAWMLDLADGLEHPEAPQDLRASRHRLISAAVRRRDPGERISFEYLAAMGQDRGRLIALRRLVASTRGSAHRFETARVRLGYGRLLSEAGEVIEARQVLATAAATFDALGAHGWSATAARYRSMAVDQDTSDDDLVRGGIDFPIVDVSLTEQETRVARLAAAGLSNKEIGERLFLSPRTVGGHLYNIFPKLGVRSRAGLRDALNRSRDGRSRPAS